MWIIYCDGACKGNPGPGGWGLYAKNKDTGDEFDFYGHLPETTNNQMELSAAIFTCKMLKAGETAIVYTDSNYVRDGLSKWIHGWKKNGWKTATKQPVKNVDLWKELDALNNDRKISWNWVKGHSGDYGNERADQLANKGAAGEDNYHEFEAFAKRLIGEGTHGKGKAKKNNTLTNGKELFTFQKEVVVYPDKKGYLLTDSKDREFIFLQEDYDNLK